jgi:hypothetical protein
MGWTTGVRLPAGEKDFSLFHSVQTGSRDHPASYPMGIRGSFPGVRRPGSETDHPLPPSAEVNNGGAIPPLPDTFSWRSV